MEDAGPWLTQLLRLVGRCPPFPAQCTRGSTRGTRPLDSKLDSRPPLRPPPLAPTCPNATHALYLPCVGPATTVPSSGGAAAPDRPLHQVRTPGRSGGLPGVGPARHRRLQDMLLLSMDDSRRGNRGSLLPCSPHAGVGPRAGPGSDISCSFRGPSAQRVSQSGLYASIRRWWAPPAPGHQHR